MKTMEIVALPKKKSSLNVSGHTLLGESCGCQQSVGRSETGTGCSSGSLLNPAVASESFAFLMAIITHCLVVMCSTLAVWELAVVHLCLMRYSYRLRALIKHCSTIISPSHCISFTLHALHPHTLAKTLKERDLCGAWCLCRGLWRYGYLYLSIKRLYLLIILGEQSSEISLVREKSTLMLMR